MQLNNPEKNLQELEVNDDIEIVITDENDSSYETDQNDDFENKNGEEEKESRFKEGELLSLIRVRFPGNARSFPFLIGKRKFAYGQKVVAMSDRGMTVGYINSFPYEVKFNKSMLPLRSIAKVATEEDIRIQKDFRDHEKKAEVVCLRLIERYNLDMVLTHVEFIQFGKKAVFYFNAPERVDFRELVKDLVADLKMRIELRQISVRDRAAALGAIGACGLQTCCSSFLKNYGNVSIKMAKNQNLALIPSKLNGVCGQIKCCIKYEDDVYADKRKNLPKEMSIIKVANGDIGKVLKLHLLVEQFEILTDFGAKRRYAVSQFIGEDNLPPNYKFPETFDHIVDETKEVIGLTKEEKSYADRFMSEQEEDEYDDSMSDENDDDVDDVDPFDDETGGINTSAKETAPQERPVVADAAKTQKETSRDSQAQQGRRPHSNHQNRNHGHNHGQKNNRNPDHRNNQNNQNQRSAPGQQNQNQGQNNQRPSHHKNNGEKKFNDNRANQNNNERRFNNNNEPRQNSGPNNNRPKNFKPRFNNQNKANPNNKKTE